MKKLNLKQICVVGVMAALVFAASNLSIEIPTAIDGTRIHLGNITCILSGLLLGGVPGGLAAGIGSMFFDLFNPKYISSAPFTLVFKFFIGFIAGKIAYGGGRDGTHHGFNILGAALGSVAYMVLYLGKSYITARIVKLMAVNVALLDVGAKALVSGINAVIAVVVAVPLAAAIRAAMSRANVTLK